MVRKENIDKEFDIHSSKMSFAGSQASASPFKVSVAPTRSAKKKCRVYGRGIQAKGVRINDKVDFTVIAGESGDRMLKVTVKNPEGNYLPVEQKLVNPNTYEFRYQPIKAGPHLVNIAFNTKHEVMSLFNVEVGPYKEFHKKAYGPGLKGGIVGFSADFCVATNWTLFSNQTPGLLTFDIKGPSQASIDCIDNFDGSANVSYWPTAAGEYTIHVLCDGEDILGSPFMAWVKQKCNFDPTKVYAFGPGVDKDTKLIIKRPVEFTIDCSKAGVAALKVTITDADFNKLVVSGANNRNGTYTCCYTPVSLNYVFVTYGGVVIPKFPVKVAKRLFFNLSFTMLQFRFNLAAQGRKV